MELYTGHSQTLVWFKPGLSVSRSCSSPVKFNSMVTLWSYIGMIWSFLTREGLYVEKVTPRGAIPNNKVNLNY